MAHFQKLFSHCLNQIKTTPHIGRLCFIIFAAALLRLWLLDTHAIFFGDAAHDVFAAHQALEEKTIPLLGIPSSIPRFRQGPVAVWINMVGLLLFGNTLLPISVIYAAISIAAVIALYETVTLAVNQKTGLAASAFLALSPLAIAHGRMPYHVNPIPLALVLYLWSLYRLGKHAPWALFGAAFAWGVLFQFELATAPLFLLIGYVLWRTKQLFSSKNVLPVLTGVSLALLPQIVYDLTHSFQHLGGFALWIVYRLGSFGLGGEHHFSLAKLATVGKTFSLYIGRIWLVDQSLPSMLAVAASLLILLLITWQLIRLTKTPQYIEYTVVATWLLIGAFIIHGAPSEAYMPPFIILVPVLVGYWWQTLSNTRQKMLCLAWIIVGIINVARITQNNWFVSTQHQFSYGPGTGEQQAVVSILKERYPGFVLATTDPGGIFPSYLANYRWWILAENLPPAPSSAQQLYVDLVPSPLLEYPNTKITTLQTVQLIELYDQL